MDNAFTELGRTVYTQWQKQNFSLAEFPGIACQALTDRPPAGNVDLADFIREFLLNDEQPLQTSSGFGQPELVVYDNQRFYIQLLFWLDGTTQIHQHEFSGAFHVLEGSSLHSEYDFTNVQPVSAHCRVGDLRLKEARLLNGGSTVPIVSGGGHIHSLFHLDTPSVTVVIRTHSDPGTGPQFTYLPPHLAVDPFYTDALTTRRNQLLDVLERTGDPSYADRVGGMISNLDFERGFFVLQNGMAYLRELGVWDEIWQRFGEKHGRLADFALPTLEEMIWRDTLVGFRSSITDIEHRYFLALLLNIPTQAGILRLVSERFPADPTAAILRWMEELSEPAEGGVWILDAVLPLENSKGIFEVLRDLLKGDDSLSAEADALRNILKQSSLRTLIS